MLPGIDVSNHQAVIDWPRVAAAGYWFALCKATERTTFRDPYFPHNWVAAKAAGLVRGAYHYARPELGNGPEAEAEFFLQSIRAVGLEPGDLLVLDMESGNGNLADWTLRWLRAVAADVGFKPLLYSGRWFMDPHGLRDRDDLAEYGLWLADYNAEPVAPPNWPFWAIWQHSSTGIVPGVNGPCDLNWFNGDDIAQLRAYGLPDGKPEPKPEPDPLLLAYRDALTLQARANRETAAALLIQAENLEALVQ